MTLAKLDTSSFPVNEEMLPSSPALIPPVTEQFLPLVESYPWDSKHFRFLGSPIDGIQFEEDRIILVEFKSSFSQMSGRQRKIKNLVEQGKVEFELIRAG